LDGNFLKIPLDDPHFVLKLCMKYFLIISLVFFLGSCAFHSGTLNSTTTAEPVFHKDIGVGVASTHLVFGLGGLSKDALILEARKNLMENRPLEGAEQYNNISTDFKRTVFLMVFKTKVTMVADVVAPKDSVNQPTYSDEYLSKMSQPNFAWDLFGIVDSVYVGKYDLGIIMRFIEDDSDGKVEVQYNDSEGDFRTKIVSSRKIYTREKTEHKGYRIGQELTSGRIIGFGLDRILVDHPADAHMITKY